MDRGKKPAPVDKNQRAKPDNARMSARRDAIALVLLNVVALGIAAVLIWKSGGMSGSSAGSKTSSPASVTLSYSDLSGKVDADQVSTVRMRADGTITGTLRDGRNFTSRLPTAAPDNGFVGRLLAHGVDVKAEPTPTSGWQAFMSLLPWLLPIAFIVWLLRSGRRATGTAGQFARSKASMVDPAQPPTTTFADIAGYEGVKDEIHEVVDYLRQPEKYHEAGAKGPGGVLMVGPPGTGKTLFARAIAGEADVAFFSVSASSFVELFVGVGASRVRDLFRQAREKAPAIVFIDEIDAIGQVRSRMHTNGNDEREQTLNQLLAEMDGFDPAKGVVVLAATNRPDTLDPALLRPGRFDRQVVIPLPNQEERLAILAVHCRTKRLGSDVDLRTVARATPGFSGADLANLANEAAIVAVRDSRVVLSAADFDSARDRIVLGRRDRGNVLLADERHLVALHEAGHALVAAFSPHADPVAKISILPAGNALGVTHQLPVDERHVYTEAYLRDALAVRLAGRTAERLVLGERSSGAADDLAAATRLAIRMVRELGLSEELGPAAYPAPEVSNVPVILSNETQQAIDQAVAGALREAEQRATAVLTVHRRELEQVAGLLEQQEVLDGSELYRVLRLAGPGSRADAEEHDREPGPEPIPDLVADAPNRSHGAVAVRCAPFQRPVGCSEDR